MKAMVSNSASDAAQSVVDALNKGSVTGWDLLAAVVVIVVSVPLARLAAAAVRRAFDRAGLGSNDAAADLGRLAKWLVYLFAFALAASILGVNVGFLSVLFAFALVIGVLVLKPMVENSASGILLLARPSFGVGDQIRTSEFRGTVEEIGSRSTVLRRSDGVKVYVSNNQVLGSPILVYSSADSRKASFDVRVPAGTDLDHVTSVLTTAVTSVDDVVDDPAPAIQATAVADNAVTLSIGYWFPSSMESGSSVTDAVVRSTMAALRKADIVLAVPEARVTERTTTSGGSGSGADGTGDGGETSDDDPNGAA